MRQMLSRAAAVAGIVTLAGGCSSAASTTTPHIHHAAPAPPARQVTACREAVTWFNVNDQTQQEIYATRAALDSQGTRLAADFIKLVNASASNGTPKRVIYADAHAVWVDCAAYGVRGPWAGVLYPPGPGMP